MKEVYLLSRGEYQDYRIVGIYSTKKKVLKAVKFMAKKEGCQVERFKLNKNY